MTHLIRGVQNGRFETLRDPGFRILDPCFFQGTILTAIDSKEMSRAYQNKYVTQSNSDSLISEKTRLMAS